MFTHPSDLIARTQSIKEEIPKCWLHYCYNDGVNRFATPLLEFNLKLSHGTSI